MKKVNKMNFLLEETSKWLLSLGLIISMGACSDNDSDENVPNPGHTPLTDVQVAPRNPYLHPNIIVSRISIQRRPTLSLMQ